MEGATEASTSSSAQEAKKHTQSPTVTGSSILGIKYRDGVILAGDVSLGYGKMTKYMQVSRLHVVNERCVVGFSGEFSDFQYICRLLENLILQDYNMSDGAITEPSEVHEYLTRVLYNRRNKFNPLWNSLVVGGVQLDGSEYLGAVDLVGSNYLGDCVATGFGNYLAMPLLRRYVEDEDYASLDEDKARRVLEESLRVLFYRDCVTTCDVQLAFIRKDGTAVVEPAFRLSSSWEVGLYKVPSTVRE